jgi:hypothetical protein
VSFDTETVVFTGQKEPVVIGFQQKADIVPQPTHLIADYDSNTGVASLHWDPVKGVPIYGVRRIEPATGDTRQPYFMADSDFTEAAYLPRDSVQQRLFVYQVFGVKRTDRLPVNVGPMDTVRAVRPILFGPRIDSLALISADSGYHMGDTVRIVASWRNAMRGNDTLYWRVKGHPEIQAGRAHPPERGKDTLSFVLTSAGGLEIGITLVDAEGYRSWLSRSFPFYGNP